MNKQEWLAARQKGIGGSEASAIMGMNPYMTNVELWEYKTGKRVREDIDNTAMKYGRDAERALIELFALDYPEYEVTIPEPYTLIYNPQYSFILGTTDANLTEIATGDKGFNETKTTLILASQQKEQWNDRVPDNYYIQDLHYFLCNPEFKFSYINAQLKTEWKKDGHKVVKKRTEPYFFLRENLKEDLEILLEAEIEFWEKYVIRDIRPNLKLPNI